MFVEFEFCVLAFGFVQASERRLELLSKSEVVGVGTAKKLRGAFFFSFFPLLGGIMGGKEDMEARASKRSLCGWLGRGVLGGSPEA